VIALWRSADRLFYKVLLAILNTEGQGTRGKRLIFAFLWGVTIITIHFEFRRNKS